MFVARVSLLFTYSVTMASYWNTLYLSYSMKNMFVGAAVSFLVVLVDLE